MRGRSRGCPRSGRGRCGGHASPLGGWREGVEGASREEETERISKESPCLSLPLPREDKAGVRYKGEVVYKA